MALTVYHYPTCSTCRKALKWLDEQRIKHARVHIVEQPPSAPLLKKALASGLPLRALFNTSGESYRNGGFKDRLATMSEAEALKALAADGKLIKRPFVIRDGRDGTAPPVFLTGFDEAAWKQSLG